jgi:hypothetical protein
MNLYDIFEAGGTGVIASKSQANDPRYSMSLTKDVRPGQIQKSLKAFNLAEDTEPDFKTVGNKFVQLCADALDLKELPKILLVKEIGQSEHPTFGTFDPNTNTIRVAYEGRHIMDVLRTLGHELTHHKQREENRIKPGDGETGSDIENEANAKAGVLMRDFADQNADLFATDDQLSEYKDPPAPDEYKARKPISGVFPDGNVIFSKHFFDERRHERSIDPNLILDMCHRAAIQRPDIIQDLDTNGDSVVIFDWDDLGVAVSKGERHDGSILYTIMTARKSLRYGYAQKIIRLR